MLSCAIMESPKHSADSPTPKENIFSGYRPLTESERRSLQQHKRDTTQQLIALADLREGKKKVKLAR